MEIAILTGLLGFVFVTTVTPGPNNLMLLASGANFGYRRSLPHMFGIASGMFIMVGLVGMGLLALFTAIPAFTIILKAVSVCYLLWLALKIARAKPIGESGEGKACPMSFLQAVMFQWVNPKAWAMALSAVSLYAADGTFESVSIVAGAFGLICLPSNSLWTWLGTLLRRWLSDPVKLRLFNFSMAALLMVTLYPVLTTAL